MPHICSQGGNMSGHKHTTCSVLCIPLWDIYLCLRNIQLQNKPDSQLQPHCTCWFNTQVVGGTTDVTTEDAADLQRKKYAFTHLTLKAMCEIGSTNPGFMHHSAIIPHSSTSSPGRLLLPSPDPHRMFTPGAAV